MIQLSRWFYYRFPVTIVAVLQPPDGRNLQGLGCSPFARHYLGNHYCFLFLQVLRCFSSLGWLHLDVSSSTIRVAPFGDLRISGRLHLPEAFRSLPRPSSPDHVQFTVILIYQGGITHEGMCFHHVATMHHSTAHHISAHHVITIQHFFAIGQIIYNT